MNDYGLVVTLGLLLNILLLGLSLLFGRASYRNGVRDGYQNTFLPHIRKQVQQEGLTQGEEIPIPYDSVERSSE